MRVSVSPDFAWSVNAGHVRTESLCGVVSYASHTRVVEAMVRSGELRLGPGEKVEAIELSDSGIKFVIGDK